MALGSTGCMGRKNFPRINNHGWVLGYSTDEPERTTFHVCHDSAHGQRGDLASGGGVAADSEGNIYFETADAAFDHDSGGEDFGNSVIRLDSDLDFGDYFTPYNQGTLFEPTGSRPWLLRPDRAPGSAVVSNSSSGGDRQGRRDLLDQPGFDGRILRQLFLQQQHRAGCGPPSPLTGCQSVNNTTTCTYGPPSYWNNTIYFPGLIAPMLAYTLSNDGTNVTLSSLPSSQTTGTFSGVGPISVSSNGTGNAIAWSITWGPATLHNPTGRLRAFDANNLATEFYDSDAAANKRDTSEKQHATSLPPSRMEKCMPQPRPIGGVWAAVPLSPTEETTRVARSKPRCRFRLPSGPIDPYTGEPASGDTASRLVIKEPEAHSAPPTQPPTQWQRLEQLHSAHKSGPDCHHGFRFDGRLSDAHVTANPAGRKTGAGFRRRTEWDGRHHLDPADHGFSERFFRQLDFRVGHHFQR